MKTCLLITAILCSLTNTIFHLDLYRYTIKVIGITSVLFVLAILLCSNLGFAHEMQKCGLSEEIIAIEKEVVDLTFMGELFRSTKFRDLYSSPNHNMESIITTLKCKEMSDVQKKIAVLTMQQLPLQDFLVFVDTLFAMLEKHEIPVDVFTLAVFPPFEWNTSLQEHYEDEIVRTYLNKLLTSDLVPGDLKDYIRQVLSGEVLSNIRKFKDAGLL